MAGLLSASEASLRLAQGRSGFVAAVRDGAIRPRAEGRRCYWPEEVSLAAWRRRSDAALLVPLLALASDLIAADNVPAIADTAARHVHLLTAAERVAIYALTRDPTHLRRVDTGDLLALPPVLLPDDLATWDDIVSSPAPVLLSDAPRDARFAPDFVARHDLRRLVVVPLRAGGQTTGALFAADWPDRALLSPAQLSALADMGAMVALALARAGRQSEIGVPAGNGALADEPLAGERDTADEHSRAAQVPLGEAALEAMQSAATGDTAVVLASLGRALTRLVPDGLHAILRLDTDGRHLRRIYASSLAGTGDPAESIPMGEGLLDEVVARRASLHLDQAERDPRARLHLLGPGLRPHAEERGLHVIALPLVAGPTTLGALAVVRIGGQPFSSADFAALQAFAGPAASALHVAESLARARAVRDAALSASAAAHTHAGGSDTTESATPTVRASLPTATVPTAGQIGDAHALGLLVELAGMTRHIPNLAAFLQHVTEMVRRRLDYEDVMLMLVDDAGEHLFIAAHSGSYPASASAGYRQPIDVGIRGEVVRTGRPRNVVDVTAEPDFFATWPDPHGSELVVPLVVDDRTIGLINVESRRVAAFTAADVEALTAVAGQVAAAVHVAQLHDQLKRAASTDGLTGLANHRAFYEALDHATAAGDALSVVVLDVEGLKQVNDSAGHLAGDALLRRMATVIQACVRPGDLVARYGGDEFAIVMLGASRPEATHTAAQIRERLARDPSDGSYPCATVRFGVACYPDDGTRPLELVAAADRRLYRMRAARANVG